LKYQGDIDSGLNKWKNKVNDAAKEVAHAAADIATNSTSKTD
jgi:hypothetical protein